MCSLSICLLFAPRAPAFDKKSSAALSHYIMGVFHEDLGDIDKAIEEYKAVLKSGGESAAVHLSLASGYIKKDQIHKAIEELNLAARLDPEAVEPHAVLAVLYSSQNKINLAAVEYEQALKIAAKQQPENIDIYKSLGLLYLQQRKLKEAEGIFRLITDLSPDETEAYFYLASVHNELKNNALAEKELKKALELKPDYHQALNFLGYMYAEGGKNLDKAQLLIKKALELEPDNGAYIDSLGWVYFKKGKTKEALTELTRAGSLLDDPVIYDHLGDAYLKLNDPDNAILNWQKSLKLEPGQNSVKEKLEKLLNARGRR